MNFILSPEELDRVQGALLRYGQEELDVQSMIELPVRVRMAVFVCIARGYLSPDGAWQGPFAQLVRAALPTASASFINNLGTELRKSNLRVTTSLGGASYEVLFLTSQLAELTGVDLLGTEDEAGPEYFIGLLDRLGHGSDEWAPHVAGLIVQYGCQDASRLLHEMLLALDPDSLAC